MTDTKRAVKPGQRGNPAGRPKGSRNRLTLALEAIFEGEAEAITSKAIVLALGGDTHTASIAFLLQLFDRIPDAGCRSALERSDDPISSCQRPRAALGSRPSGVLSFGTTPKP